MPGVCAEFGVPANPEASILAATSEKGNSFYLTPPPGFGPYFKTNGITRSILSESGLARLTSIPVFESNVHPCMLLNCKIDFNRYCPFPTFHSAGPATSNSMSLFLTLFFTRLDGLPPVL
jgi:hypothetical protein